MSTVPVAQIQEDVQQDKSDSSHVSITDDSRRKANADAESCDGYAPGTTWKLEIVEPAHLSHHDPDFPAQPRKPLTLFSAYFVVNLVALSFGLDSSLYLPTVVALITRIEPANVTRTFFLVQTISSIAQVVVMLTIGLIVHYCARGSLKASIALLIAASAAGNLIYTIGGVKGSVTALIIGRVLCGVASASSGVAGVYLSLTSSVEERLLCMTNFRTFAGVALVLGPLLSALFGLADFYIGSFHFDKLTAPTLGSFLIMTVLTVVILVAMEEQKSKAAASPFAALPAFVASKPKGAALALLGMLLSAYASALILYIVPINLTSRWNYSVQSEGYLFALINAVGLVGSLCADWIKGAALRLVVRIQGTGQPDDMEDKDAKAASKNSARVAEVALAIGSFLVAAIGITCMLISVTVDGDDASLKTAVVFMIGAMIVMASYNIQASVIPSIFSKLIPAALKVALMPWMSAMTAVGKVLAPALTDSFSASAGGLGLEYGFPIATSVFAVVLFAVGKNALSQ
ncbi:hypothetical protein HDU86_001299 [Geranomyces michiganensis]|nr:hypothetical protein HDU86_001299 [Geranomyces michiganensis]